ncbi:hydroxyectoine utilization dehydratase EutB [Chromohalobacter canadensis]|uniref:hydroxyectoine utilization dehydratase EutB n=1 Tax=Chromohalobacter canadensis TaxID=141389 RepID=UPI0021C22FCD|nr:hydroxyectoine utilization dehydratase EutB [Chromohalobacter canadensis]MCT8468538.1 hydroxyectoine utilization dehydratase EutB [Chromohalobacter canadensis]MCT8471593.1 hydroxyectoine utilization dehydratase EutB [Chromohalobacter canadensis]MCT8499046.1 hydroxyectoine utilization dehydratase EutB [Chromohalobacter canadensis]
MSDAQSAINLASIYAARARLQGQVARTPLVRSQVLSRRFEADIFLKLETSQPTGAFKLRGATNMIAALIERDGRDALARGVTTASTGNHGRAVAHAAYQLGIPAVICLSRLVPENKAAAIEALGAEVRRVGENQDDSFDEVERLVASGMTAIPPFDDPLIVSGQGTIGLELMEDQPTLDRVIVGLSGGGLLGGIGAAVKAIRPATRVTGVSLSQGAAMWESLQVGHPVNVAEVESLGDSLGGGIGLDNRCTFALVREVMDDHYQVSEPAIARAMVDLLDAEKMLVEGAAAVGLAALDEHGLDIRGQRVALIVSGNGVALEAFDRARALAGA